MRTLVAVLIVILNVNGLIRSPIHRYSSLLQRQQPLSMTDVQHEKDSNVKVEGKGGLKITNIFDLSQYRINKPAVAPSISIVNETEISGIEGNGTTAGSGSAGSTTTFLGSRFGFYTPQQPIMLTKAENDLQSMKSELSLMKSRLEKVSNHPFPLSSLCSVCSFYSSLTFFPPSFLLMVTGRKSFCRWQEDHD